MIKIKLSKEERENLKQARNMRDSKICERSLYVLLSDEGKGVSEIAEQTKRNEHTIRHWLTAYREGGIKGLEGTSPPGRTAKKAPAIYPIILDIIPKSPNEYGYIEEGWTINMIVDYLKREGIEVGATTVKRVLKKTVGSIRDLPKQSRSMPQMPKKKGQGL